MTLAEFKREMFDGMRHAERENRAQILTDIMTFVGMKP